MIKLSLYLHAKKVWQCCLKMRMVKWISFNNFSRFVEGNFRMLPLMTCACYSLLTNENTHSNDASYMVAVRVQNIAHSVPLPPSSRAVANTAITHFVQTAIPKPCHALWLTEPAKNLSLMKIHMQALLPEPLLMWLIAAFHAVDADWQSMWQNIYLSHILWDHKLGGFFCSLNTLVRDSIRVWQYSHRRFWAKFYSISLVTLEWFWIYTSVTEHRITPTALFKGEHY